MVRVFKNTADSGQGSLKTDNPVKRKVQSKERNQMPRPFKLNLQFFSDVIRGGYNPDEEIHYPETNNPLVEEEPSGEGAPETPDEPQQPEVPEVPEGTEPPKPSTFDFGGRIVDPNNPETIEGAYQDFQQSQRFIQQLIQENRNMQQQFQQFQQQYQQSQPPAPKEPEIDIEKQNELMMEKFYDNPTQFFKELQQKAVEEARREFEPIVKERRMQTEIQSVSSKYQDFQEYVPKMRELVEELGEQTTEQLGLERVYLMAKGQAGLQQPPAPQPEQMLQDPNFLNQYVLNNPQIQQQIVQNYMAQKQQSQPPKVMGNTSGGAQSLASEERPKSIGEASRLLRKSWGI